MLNTGTPSLLQQQGEVLTRRLAPWLSIIDTTPHAPVVGGASVIVTTVLTALGAAAGAYGATAGAGLRVLATAAAVVLNVAVVICAEFNAVRARRLWPRSLLTPFTDNVELTSADQRAYISYAKTEQHKSFENIDVSFGSPPQPGPARPEP